MYTIEIYKESLGELTHNITYRRKKDALFMARWYAETDGNAFVLVYKRYWSVEGILCSQIPAMIMYSHGRIVE